MASFFKQPDSQATQWQNKFVTGIKVFTQNDLTVFVVLIWYLPIVNLLSFLSVLTDWGYFFVNYSSSLTLFWMILMLCIWLHRISFRRSKVLKTCSHGNHGRHKEQITDCYIIILAQREIFIIFSKINSIHFFCIVRMF